MSASTVYYFVDSNLFLQCRPLEQLDWTPWNAFEEVRLIVSSPVLREIDYRKNKGSDRVGTRARATSAMFREMLQEGHKVVRASSPRVVLSIEPQHTYSRDCQRRREYVPARRRKIGELYTKVTKTSLTAPSLCYNVPLDQEDMIWQTRPQASISEKVSP